MEDSESSIQPLLKSIKGGLSHITTVISFLSSLTALTLSIFALLSTNIEKNAYLFKLTHVSFEEKYGSINIILSNTGNRKLIFDNPNIVLFPRDSTIKDSIALIPSDSISRRFPLIMEPNDLQVLQFRRPHNGNIKRFLHETDSLSTVRIKMFCSTVSGRDSIFKFDYKDTLFQARRSNTTIYTFSYREIAPIRKVKVN